MLAIWPWCLRIEMNGQSIEILPDVNEGRDPGAVVFVVVVVTREENCSLVQF